MTIISHKLNVPRAISVFINMTYLSEIRAHADKYRINKLVYCFHPGESWVLPPQNRLVT